METPTVQRSEHREWNQCQRKVRFERKGQAEQAAQKARRQHGRHLMLVPYHCGICGGWHVGNDLPKRQRTQHEKEKRKAFRKSRQRDQRRQATEGE